MHKILKQLVRLGLPLALGAVAWANSVPIVSVTVNGGTGEMTVTTGTTLTIVGKSVDTDGDMKEHWLEIQNPSGAFSWEGWLTGEPWAGALVGSSFSSTKTGNFTVTDTGKYTFRSTAIDTTSAWIISNEVHVTVTAAVTVPDTNTGTTTPPVTVPVVAVPVVVPPVVVVTLPAVVTSTPTTTTTTTPDTATTGSGAVFKSDGSVDAAAYASYYSSWDRASASARLGPTFEALNPGAVDDRPTNYSPSSHANPASYIRVNPYELGPKAGSYPDSDYWSESGQVAYAPDDQINDPGLDRLQVFAYYDHVFAVAPRLDYASTPAHPEPQTLEWEYQTLLGHLPHQPIAMTRGVAMVQNEALVVYKDGLLAAAGTQTSRDASNERPYPGLVFPANKVMTGIATTASNEFAVITVWDTSTQRGQLAVVALEGKFIPYHTWPYMGLPNQGSWSDMKLLGYVDLPMSTPTSVSAASNGWWAGPSQTAGQDFGSIDLTNPWTRAGFLTGDPQWAMVVASKGYAIVSSKMENKVVIVDLSPVFEYARQSYLSSSDSYWKTLSTRGSGPGQWPLTFAEKPEITPKVVWQGTFTKPTTVLAGPHIDRWSRDRQKAYIACEDGTIHIMDTSPLMARFGWETFGALGEMGTFKVGRNPTSMAFMRHADWAPPLIPAGSEGPGAPDTLNNVFYVVCRGDREVDGCVTFGGQGVIYRRIRDTRMGDPVAVSVALRGNIVSVTDFSGKKMISYRVGGLWDRAGVYYGAGADGNADFDCGGVMTFTGYPFLINSVNVN